MGDRPLLSPIHHAPIPTVDLSVPPGIQQATLEALREPALAAQGAVLRSKVERIVVLMLENRSFDHLLGWLGPDAGLKGTETNPLPVSPVIPRPPVRAPRQLLRKTVKVFRTTETALPICPTHANRATLREINDGKMDGFVTEFIDKRADEIAATGPIDGHPPEHMPMAYYGPESLPAYRHLVEHHAVCTSYHASVPAGTWPNRMYLYAGHSGGLFNNGKARPRERDPAYDALMPQRLLVDLLDEAKVTWRVYSHDFAWMRLFPKRDTEVFWRHTMNFRHFDAHCRRESLPAVVFIDPNWTDFGAKRANDDLAPCDLMNGQRLVADVYNGLRTMGNAEREKTLLVVSYDEHGGFYDHVAPPPTIGKNAWEVDTGFETYGVRVPTFVVSAHTPSGLTDVLLDHASLHATIHRTFVPDAPFLSPRAKVADTFGALLTRSTPSGKPPAMVVPGEDKVSRSKQGDGTTERARTRRATADDDEDGGFRAWVATLRERGKGSPR